MVAHTLILGTMPGAASLSAQQYYAHPRNAFWPIMLAIIKSMEPSFEQVSLVQYAQRCKLLTDHGYALWDVLARCRRPGSLDSRIDRSSEEPNDIVDLIARHPELTRIACNGKKASTLLQRHCRAALTELNEQGRELSIVNLPSTSPAMASLSLLQKHERWVQDLCAW
jgi:hypoxanthine-DNA glycosylase